MSPTDVHPSDAELESLNDGELAAGDERRLRLHLDGCEACAARHRGIQLGDRRIGEWLSALDHPAPQLDADALVTRSSRRTRGPGLLAAGLATLLVAAGAAAMVIPGSPVQRFVERVFADRQTGAAPDAPEPATVQPPPASGVSFIPEPDLEVVFLRGQTEGAIRISLAEAPEVRVRVVGGSAAYRLDPAELIVDNRGPGSSYEVVLPRSIPHARVRIGERVVFEKQGAAISGSFLERRETYVVPFGAAGYAAPEGAGPGEERRP